MKQRLEYIDILRAFAIFLVTLGHALEYGGYCDGLLHGVIYSFHMPLFFAISGFVAAYSLRNDSDARLDLPGFARLVWKKFRFIMIPYFAWNLVVHPFAFSGCKMSMEGYRFLCRSVLVANDSAWFLPCLFNLHVLLGLHRLALGNLKRAKAGILIEIAGLGLMFGVLAGIQHFAANPFLRSVLSYFIPFYVGVFLGRSEDLERRYVDSQWSFLIGAAVFAVAAGVFASGGEGFPWRIARLAAGVSSIPVMFALAKATTISGRTGKFIAFVGQSTLAIYCMQNWVRVPDLGAWQMTPMLQFVVFGLYSLVAVCAIAACTKALERNAVLRQVLLGKK